MSAKAYRDTATAQAAIDMACSHVAPHPLIVPASTYDRLKQAGADLSRCIRQGQIPTTE